MGLGRKGRSIFLCAGRPLCQRQCPFRFAAGPLSGGIVPSRSPPTITELGADRLWNRAARSKLAAVHLEASMTDEPDFTGPYKWSFSVTNLLQNSDLEPSKLRDIIAPQLEQQGLSSWRQLWYSVKVVIRVGRVSPAHDIDNYAKKVLDGVTKTERLWRDDRRIDRLVVTRTRDMSEPDSTVEGYVGLTKGQHTGFPTFCQTLRYGASMGGDESYAKVGYALAGSFGSEQPWDLTPEEWSQRIDQLRSVLGHIESARNWFDEHFPLVMDHVPSSRTDSFLKGVIRANEDDRMYL